MVSAVRGMGEGLVGGEVTPDEWTVRGDAVEIVHAPERAVGEGAVRQIAGLAREAGALSARRRTWSGRSRTAWLLLEARPITALPEPPTLDVPEGFWTKDEAHYPAPLPPRRVHLPAGDRVRDGGDDREFGLPFERMYQRSLGGEAYTRVVPRWQGPPAATVVGGRRRDTTRAGDAP